MEKLGSHQHLQGSPQNLLTLLRRWSQPHRKADITGLYSFHKCLSTTYYVSNTPISARDSEVNKTTSYLHHVTSAQNKIWKHERSCAFLTQDASLLQNFWNSVPSAQNTLPLLLTPTRSTGLRLNVTFVCDPPNLNVMPGHVLLTAPSVCLLQDVSLLTATAALLGHPLLHPLHPGGQGLCVLDTVIILPGPQKISLI